MYKMDASSEAISVVYEQLSHSLTDFQDHDNSYLNSNQEYLPSVSPHQCVPSPCISVGSSETETPTIYPHNNFSPPMVVNSQGGNRVGNNYGSTWNQLYYWPHKNMLMMPPVERFQNDFLFGSRPNVHPPNYEQSYYLANNSFASVPLPVNNFNCYTSQTTCKAPPFVSYKRKRRIAQQFPSTNLEQIHHEPRHNFEVVASKFPSSPVDSYVSSKENNVRLVKTRRNSSVRIQPTLSRHTHNEAVCKNTPTENHSELLRIPNETAKVNVRQILRDKILSRSSVKQAGKLSLKSKCDTSRDCNVPTNNLRVKYPSLDQMSPEVSSTTTEHTNKYVPIRPCTQMEESQFISCQNVSQEFSQHFCEQQIRPITTSSCRYNDIQFAHNSNNIFQQRSETFGNSNLLNIDNYGYQNNNVMLPHSSQNSVQESSLTSFSELETIFSLNELQNFNNIDFPNVKFNFEELIDKALFEIEHEEPTSTNT